MLIYFNFITSRYIIICFFVSLNISRKKIARVPKTFKSYFQKAKFKEKEGDVFKMLSGNEPPRYDNHSSNRCNFFFFFFTCDIESIHLASKVCARV
jgi:hypothetical protein